MDSQFQKQGLPYISVIVPFHNVCRHISACVDALVAQRYPAERRQFIFVDNNSSDGSADIVRQRQQTTSIVGPPDVERLQLLQEHKQGAYAARNCGLRQAKGQVIAFTDSDCLVAEDWLEQVAAAMADPTVQIAIGSQSFACSSGPLALLEAYEEQKKRYIFNNQVWRTYHGSCNNMAVRTGLLQEMGGFVQRERGADTILVHQCVERHGPHSVRHSQTMRIKHLEVTGIVPYYEKLATYRRSRRQYSHLASVRGLNNPQRLHVFVETVRAQRYSALQAASLLLLLAVGMAFHTVRSRTQSWRDSGD